MRNTTRIFEDAPSAAEGVVRWEFVRSDMRPRIYVLNRGTASVNIVVDYVDPEVPGNILADYDALAPAGVRQVWVASTAVGAGVYLPITTPSDIEDGIIQPSMIRIGLTTADASPQNVLVMLASQQEHKQR